MSRADKTTDGHPGQPKAPLLAGMPLRFGVMGSAGAEVPLEYLEKAFALGQAIARRGCVLITGACPGLPLAAAGGARFEGGMVVGISPALSIEEHIFKYGSPAEGHDVLVFTGSGLMGREVVNIRSSDIVVIAGGKSGTLGEFAIAYDEGKLIGVLTGTGGISDLIPDILAACAKDTGARVLYQHDPEKLVDDLLVTYEGEHHRCPSVFCEHFGEKPEAVRLFRTSRDVVCGMWIDPAVAVEKRGLAGKEYYFCSRDCAARFDTDPPKFIASAPHRR